jgi:hypothetical protein
VSFITTVFIVTVEKLDQTLQSRMWYWDRDEALSNYESITDQYDDERIVTLYSIDIEDTITERVDALMANRHSRTTVSPLEELRSNRKAPESKPEYSELRLDENSKELLIERTHNGDYWSFCISKPFTHTWRVMDSMDRTAIGRIYLQNPTALLPQYEYEYFKGNKEFSATFKSLQEAVVALLEANS